MKVFWETTKPWGGRGCWNVSLGVSLSRLTMGTTTDDPREQIMYDLSIELGVRRLRITKAVFSS